MRRLEQAFFIAILLTYSTGKTTNKRHNPKILAEKQFNNKEDTFEELFILFYARKVPPI